MAITVVETRDVNLDVLAGTAFYFVPRFLDTAGVEYTPTTVHTKVVLRSTGAQIIALTEVSDWDIGEAINVPSTWTDLVVSTELREEHIIRVIGDNGTAAMRNEIRLIVGCINPER